MEHEARMAWNGHETWYRVLGELDPASTQIPVVICHGGPGAAHDYCEPIADLASFGRACVLYDQVGCGKSQHLPEAPPDFWTPQLFKDELVELTRHLGIDGRYAVVGQSWGGMLAMEHALDHPPGLRGLVVADSPGQHAALGRRGESSAGEPTAGGSTDTAHARRGRDDGRPRVRDGGAGLLRSPPLPRRRGRTASSAASIRWRPIRPSTTR